MAGLAGARREYYSWVAMLALFLMASLLKLLVLAPGMYRSTDFEVHRNWLAVTHSTPLKEWYWEHTSEWTLDYPPLFGYLQWALSQAAVLVEPELVEITRYYEPSEAAVWFQRISVMLLDGTLVLGVVAWCKGASVDGPAGAATRSSVQTGVLVLLSSGLFLVDHVHFQYNGFLLGLLLLSMGLIRQGKVLAGGAIFACLLMLKHLFLSLAPLYFVHLLRSYCFEGRKQRPRPAEAEGLEPHDDSGPSGSGCSNESSRGGHSQTHTSRISPRGARPDADQMGRPPPSASRGGGQGGA